MGTRSVPASATCFSATNLASDELSRLGNYEKALSEYRDALRLEPNAVANYSNLGNAYVNLDLLDEAEAVSKSMNRRE